MSLLIVIIYFSKVCSLVIFYSYVSMTYKLVKSLFSYTHIYFAYKVRRNHRNYSHITCTNLNIILKKLADLICDVLVMFLTACMWSWTGSVNFLEKLKKTSTCIGYISLTCQLQTYRSKMYREDVKQRDWNMHRHMARGKGANASRRKGTQILTNL